jgi:hypothetical protein
MLEGNNDLIPKTAAPLSAKWTETSFTTKSSTRRLTKSSGVATCKDIIVPANACLERFVPPSKPMFTFSSDASVASTRGGGCY